MMPVENILDEILAVMGYVPCFAEGKRRVQIPLYVHQPALVQFHFLLAELGFEEFGVIDHRGHPADNGLVRPEKIEKGNGNDEDKTSQESQAEPKDADRRQQLLRDAELHYFYEIKYQE